jgi:hypothetical protein
MVQPTKQEKWRSLFSEQEENGESVAGFCRARGVREALFYYWKNGYEKQRCRSSWKSKLRSHS